MRVEVALSIAAPVAVAAAWLLVRFRGVSVWSATGITLGGLGALALATGEPSAGPRPWLALIGGVLAGVALYAATAAFLAVAGRWRRLGRDARELYGRRRGVGLEQALVASVAITAPGEELLWRGVVLGTLGSVFAPWVAGLLTWLGYVAANAVSGSVPILLGAIVGGAVWTGLAVWTEGVVASIGCHAVWTALMIVFPPIHGARG